jgi:hypothetical protein
MKITRSLAALFAVCMSSAALAGNDGIAVTPVVQNAAYASGNAIGGLQTVPFFRSAYLTPSGVLDAVEVISNGGSTTAITFYISTRCIQPRPAPINPRSAWVLLIFPVSPSSRSR